MSTSKEPQRNLEPFRLARNTILAIFEVPTVGAIKILEGPHSHPQRAPRTTCLRQRGHPGAPNQNFSPPLAPESRALPYHNLDVLVRWYSSPFPHLLIFAFCRSVHLLASDLYRFAAITRFYAFT